MQTPWMQIKGRPNCV